MTLKTSVQGRTRQVRDCRLQGIQAVVEGQRRVLAERHDDSFVFVDNTVDLGSVGPVFRSSVKVCFLHFATVFGLIPWRLASTLRLS